MLSKKTTGVLASIVLVGGALGVFGISEVRPWATPDEVRAVQRNLEVTQSNAREVATDSYQAQLLQIAVIISTLTIQRDQCIASNGDCAILIERVAEYEAKEDTIRRRRDRFGT